MTRELVVELGREPTTEEIAKRMNSTVEKVDKAINLIQQPISLEAPIERPENHRSETSSRISRQSVRLSE